MAEEISRCLVFLRQRPAKGDEVNEEPLYQLQDKVVKMKDDKSYEFDGTLGADSTQEECFLTVAKPCVDHAVNGYRSALMAYGQTGTGKSHTMCSTKPGHEGVIPRVAKYLFDQVAENAGEDFSVSVQFLQIYRDNLGDLMSETGREKVDISFDKDRGVTMPGCSTHKVNSADELMKLYREGDKRRVTAATAMNPESSRGHTALVLWISRVENSTAKHGKITFIDLAGYERFSKTGISEAGVMREEAKTINASLLALGHVVTSLSNNDKHIPWRNSKLTRLLQDSIGGRSRTTIILTAGPSQHHFFETTNTLQFGARAMAVKVQAKIQETVNYEHLAAKLQSILSEREERINALELQKANYDMQQEELRSRHDRDLAQLRANQEEEVQAAVKGMTQDQMAEYRKHQELELEMLVDQQKEELSYAHERNEQNTKDIVDRINCEHEREVAALKLQIQDLEDEVEEFKAQLKVPEVERKAGGRKTTLDDVPDIDEHVVAGRIDVNFYHNTVDIYEETIEQYNEKLVDLRVQLQRAQKLAQERAEDLAAMEEFAKKVQSEKATKGAAASDSDDDALASTISNIVEGRKSGGGGAVPGLSIPKISDIKMIDIKVHDQQIAALEDEMKGYQNVIQGLRKLIYTGDPKGNAERLGLDLGGSMNGLRGGGLPLITPRVSGGLCMITPRCMPGMTPRTARGGGGGGYGQSSATAMVMEQQKVQIQMLQEQLDEANAAIRNLEDEAAYRGLDNKPAAAPAAPEAAPVSKGPVPSLQLGVPALNLGKKPLMISKDKIDMTKNPIIVELYALRERVASEKKNQSDLEKEFAALLTRMDHTELRKVSDRTRALNAGKQKELEANEVKVTGGVRSRAKQANYAVGLLNGTGRDGKKHEIITLNGMGGAIGNCVAIAEIIKRRVRNVHQTTSLSHQIAHDVYEGSETGKIFEFDREIPSVVITLATRTLDRKHEGYQAPIDQALVKADYDGVNEGFDDSCSDADGPGVPARHIDPSKM